MASNLKISIDVLLKGTDQLKDLAGAIRQVANAGRGASRTAQSLQEIAVAARSAESALLRQADALTRLQQVQQGAARASQGLEKAGGGVEASLRRTAAASAAVDESLSASTGAVLAQAQAMARLQQLQGDAAGASETLRVALEQVREQQSQAVKESSSLGSKLQTAFQAGAVVLNAITAGFNFFNALQREAGDNLTEAEAAATVVTKAYAGAKAAVGSVRNAVLATFPAFRSLRTEAEAAAAAVAKATSIDAVAGQADQRVAQVRTFFEQIRDINAEQVKAGSEPVAPRPGIIDAANGLAFLARLRAANEAILAAGKEAGKSFADGVAGATPAAKKAGEALGKNTEKGIRDSLEQRSPSRVLVRLGKEAAESFAMGFEAGKEKLRAITAGDLVDNRALSPRPLRGFLDSLSDTRAGQVVSDLATRVRGLVGNVGELLATAALVGTTIAGVAAGSIALAGPLALIGKAGIEANAQLEQTRIGIASVIASVGDLRRSDGVQLKGVDALNAALPLAERQLNRLRVDALQTALTFQQIAPAFLQAIGPGLAAGLNLDQIRQTVISLSQLIVPLTGDASQLGQELRAIFSGDIGPDAQVARMLGITREIVQEAREQGRLAEVLNEKLKSAAATGQLMAQTFEAASSNLGEAGTILAATVTRGLFDALKTQINRTLPQVFEVAFGNVRIAPRFAGIADALEGVFDRVGALASRVIDAVFQAAGSISSFLTQNQAAINSIVEGAFSLLGLFGQAALIVARLVVGVGQLGSTLVLINTAIQFTVSTLRPLLGVLDAIVSSVVGLARLIDGPLSQPLGIVAQIGLLALSLRGAYQAAALLAPSLLAAGQGLAALSVRAGQVAISMTTLSGAAAAARAALAFLTTTPLGLALVAATAITAAASMGLFTDAAQKAKEAAAGIEIRSLQDQAATVAAVREQLAQVQGLTGSQANLNQEQERFRAVLSQLPPAQQAVIDKLGSQKEKVEALSGALRQNLQEQENRARAEQILLAGSITARQREIEGINAKIKSLDEELRKRKELLDAGTRQIVETVPTGAETAVIVRDIAREEADLAAARDASRQALEKLNAEQVDQIEKLRLTVRALNQTEAALLKAREAGFVSAEEFNRFKRALDEARASGRGITPAIDDVSAALQGAKTAAQQAQAELQSFFATGDNGALRKRVQDAINRIAAASAQSGKGASSAVAELNAQIAANKDGIGDNLRALRVFDAAQRALQNRISPPTRTGGGGRRTNTPVTAPAEFQDTVRIAESEFRVKQALAQREIARAQEREQTETALLREQLDERRISIAEYYSAIAELQRASSEAQITAVEQESTRIGSEIVRVRIDALNALARLREERASALIAAKAAQRPAVEARFDRAAQGIETKTKTEINELTAKQIELDTRLGSLRGKAVSDEAKLNSERGKSLRALGQQFEAISRVIQGSIGGGFETEIDQRLGGIQETIRAIEAETRAEIEERQTLVARGLLSEIAARQIIFGLEQKASAEIQAQLEAAARLIRLLPDSERKRQLTAETRQGQAENRARAISPQEILTGDLRRGLTADLTGAFTDFVANAQFSLEGLRDFALGVVGSLRRALGRVIEGFVERRVVQPLVDKLLGGVFGLKIDPATVANTAATTANTAALAALTAAIATGSITGAAGDGFALALPDNLGEIAGQGGDANDPAAPLRSVFDRIGSAIQDFAKKVGGFVGNIGSGLRSIGSAIVGFLSSLLGGLGSGGGAAASPDLIAGFAEGGYTGDGARLQPAGIVHAGEFVQPAHVVSRWGAGFFEAIRAGAITPANLAEVANSLGARYLRSVQARASRGYAEGGLVGAIADPQAAQGAARGVRIINVNDGSDVQNFLDSAQGEQVILNRITRSPAKFRAALGVS